MQPLTPRTADDPGVHGLHRRHEEPQAAWPQLPLGAAAGADRAGAELRVVSHPQRSGTERIKAPQLVRQAGAAGGRRLACHGAASHLRPACDRVPSGASRRQVALAQGVATLAAFDNHRLARRWPQGLRRIHRLRIHVRPREDAEARRAHSRADVEAELIIMARRGVHQVQVGHVHARFAKDENRIVAAVPPCAQAAHHELLVAAMISQENHAALKASRATQGDGAGVPDGQ
mmetsp:Transcript_75197/g.230066  ORF Transcript_75197/g.230066 Transcript_75197/m.230066 type:complete len:232 (+) Transcript_75197:296-991(+)